MFDFPSSPVNGQQYKAPSGQTYIYNGSVWLLSQGMTGSGVTSSDNPPPAPVPGQLWFEADSGNSYIWYVDQDGGQWIQFNVSTAPANALLNITKTVVTASQIYTKPAGLKFLELEGQAAGGGGGGCAATTAGQGSAGSGGGAGGYFRHFLPAASVPASLTLTIGAAGTGGTVAGGSGAGAGGNLTVTELSLTAFGGGGGTTGGGSTANVFVQGGNGGSATGGNLLNLQGGVGDLAIYISTVCAGGFGGVSMFGRGRPVTGGNMPANTIVNAGAGGSGSGSGPSNATGNTGAQGGPGMLILTEYF